jgi:non-ribosomal peptide synthase protein (TIGR01720 family)
MGRAGFFESEAPAAGTAASAGTKDPAATVASSQPADDASGTPLPVLPNVARFLVERSSPDASHWNLGVLLQRPEPIDPELMRGVVRRLVERHDALRLRFHHGINGWASTVAPASEALPYSSHDLSGLPEAEQTAAIEGHASELQRSLDLEHGPLFRIATFDLGPRGARLLVITHHFVMDGLSWRPFWEDLEAIHEALVRGDGEAELSPSTSFQEWAHTLKRRADSVALRGEMRAWLDLPWDRVRSLPLDRTDPGEGNTNGSAREVILEFSVDETHQVFQQTPRVPHKVDFLLTALAQTLAGWTDSDSVLFDMMGHGRDEEAFDDVDLFGAIGFFISYTPMVLAVPRDARTALQVLGSQIQPILRRGLDFDLLRYMTSDATIRQTFGALPRAQVLFNHLGRRDELDTVPPGSSFSLAPESIGQTHSPQGLRYYPIAISSQVWRDQLRLNFVYSENLHERTTVEALAERYREHLMAQAARWRSA